jgi:hypothetical protein
MPFIVLAAAFVPALIALVVIAAQATISPPTADSASRALDEIARKR